MKYNIDTVANGLLKGEVVLLPTDTVYGLAVSPNFEASIDRLYALKNRPRQRNLPIMVASIAALETMGIEISTSAEKLLRSHFVPGALTLAMGFKDKPLLPWLAGREEIAIRIPNNQELLAVLEKTGPLLVTSANAHGMPTPEKLEDAIAQLHGKPDQAIEGGLLKSVPSTLINCRVNPPVIERVGMIPPEALLKLLD
jgi:L-threonylcarbamoyladenylate synthase